MNPKTWEELKKGDSLALKTIYQTCFQELYVFGFRISADKETVKDAIHEMFCEIWQKKTSLADVINIKAYLKTYLKRKLIKDLAKTANHFDINLHLDEPELRGHSYEYLLIQNQSSEIQKAKIFNAINQLTSSQKEIINLKFFEGLSYEQISTLLNIQPRTAYNHIFEGLSTLKKLLK